MDPDAPAFIASQHNPQTVKIFTSLATIIGFVWLMLALIDGAGNGLFIIKENSFGIDLVQGRKTVQKVVDPMLKEAKSLSRPSTRPTNPSGL